MSKNTHWVFDYDGVIGNTLPAITKFNMHKHGLDEAGAKQSNREYAAKAKHCRRSWNAQSEAYAHQWNREFVEFLNGRFPPVFEEFVEVLSDFPHVRRAIVSNNTERSIHPVLDKVALDFSPVMGLEHHHSKEERIVRIAAIWDVELTQINFLTDTVADVLEVRHSLPLENVYACTWGCNKKMDFVPHLPDRNILEAFRDIIPLLSV